LDLLEKQAAYTLQGMGTTPTPRNIRNYILDMIEKGEGVLMPWFKKEGMPDVRTEKKKGGAVKKATGGAIKAAAKAVKPSAEQAAKMASQQAEMALKNRAMQELRAQFEDLPLGQQPQGWMSPERLQQKIEEIRRREATPVGGQIPLMQAGGAIRRAAANAITKAAEDAGMKAPVTAAKDLTSLQDFHTSLRDRIQAEAEATRKMMEGFDYKYDKGQRVFTEDSARKNKAPYEILFRTRVGNQIMYDTSGGGMKQIKDPETGKAKRTPYEPGYRVRSQTEDGVSEFEIPQRAIKGNVEMAKGGRVKFTDNLDAMRLAVQKRK
jgi:hypothetical protein